MKNCLLIIALLITTHTTEGLAQSAPEFKNFQQSLYIPKAMKPATAQLYQYGVANAFIEGLYEGELAVDQLRQQGDFGIGAPNNIDGELTIVDGKAYQSNAQGKIIPAPQGLMTPFAFVTTFRADTIMSLSNVQNLNDLFTRIETLLPHPNAIYAIRIRGTFSNIRTRAFPAVREKPFKPLAHLLDQQRFFEWKNVKGDMVGFYIPGYLSGINIVGLHFHFLSRKRNLGGHVVGVQAKELSIEIAELKEFHLLPLDTKEFSKHKFDGTNSRDLQQIEKGN